MAEQSPKNLDTFDAEGAKETFPDISARVRREMSKHIEALQREIDALEKNIQVKKEEQHSTAQQLEQFDEDEIEHIIFTVHHLDFVDGGYTGHYALRGVETYQTTDIDLRHTLGKLAVAICQSPKTKLHFSDSVAIDSIAIIGRNNDYILDYDSVQVDIMSYFREQYDGARRQKLAKAL